MGDGHVDSRWKWRMERGKWSNELKSWFHFIFNSTYFYLNADCKRFFAFFLYFIFLHFAMRAKISAITVATGAWLKREELKRKKEEGETQHGAVQQQLHFQYFCRHPNEVDLLLSRDAIYFSLSLPHSFSHSLSLSFCFAATAASFFTVASAAVCPDSCALHL